MHKINQFIVFDGKLEEEGNWKDGKRDGLLKIYYENEQLSKVLNWEEDKLISKKCWDEDGNETECE